MKALSFVFRYIVVDALGSVLYFPAWWYTTGFVSVLGWYHRTLSYQWRSYGFAIWMRNILVPMYGQYDWTGRLISFVMRVVVLIARFFAFIALSLVYGLAVVLWLIGPIVCLLLFLQSLYQGLFSAEVRAIRF